MSSGLRKDHASGRQPHHIPDRVVTVSSPSLRHALHVFHAEERLTRGREGLFLSSFWEREGRGVSKLVQRWRRPDSREAPLCLFPNENAAPLSAAAAAVRGGCSAVSLSPSLPLSLPLSLLLPHPPAVLWPSCGSLMCLAKASLTQT